MTSNNELPNWFDLKKYTPTKNFSISDWYKQLNFRLRCITAIISRDIHKNASPKLPDLLEAWKENPIVNLNDERVKDWFITSPDAPFKAIAEQRAENCFGVHLLTTAELYKIETCIPSEKRMYAAGYFANAKVNNFGVFKLPHDTYQPWFNEPALSFTEQNDFFNKACVVLNLSLSNRVLKKQFSDMLDKIREQSNTRKTNESIRSIPVRHLSHYSILPYIDLKIFEKETKAPISDLMIIAKAIFPTWDEQKAYDACRKTIPDLANKLISPWTLARLEAQAATESTHIQICKNPWKDPII